MAAETVEYIVTALVRLGGTVFEGSNPTEIKSSLFCTERSLIYSLSGLTLGQIFLGYFTQSKKHFQITFGVEFPDSSIGERNSIFRNFQEMGQLTTQVYILIFYFAPRIPRIFSWVVVRVSEIKKSRIFLKFSWEISIPLVSVLKTAEILVEWNVAIVTIQS